MPENLALPEAVQELLNGQDLRDKVGHTFLLTACQDGSWPHLALLSVGEVLAVAPDEVRLALYASSGTTRALASTGRALLVVIAAGATHKIELQAIASPPERGGNALFRTRVRRVDEDQVSYATVEHGIAFSLHDVEAGVARWRRTVDELHRLGT